MSMKICVLPGDGIGLEIMAEAVRDPLKADYAELVLMGSEKVEALSASAAVGFPDRSARSSWCR